MTDAAYDTCPLLLEEEKEKKGEDGPAHIRTVGRARKAANWRKCHPSSRGPPISETYPPAVHPCTNCRDNMNPLKLITKPKTAADLAASIAQLATDIEAAEARRPDLLRALDTAVINGVGEPEAESAITALDAELGRMRIRSGAFERGHEQAVAREEAARVAQLEADARALVAKHDKAAGAYDASARETARLARELDTLAERVRVASRAVESAGGTAPECALANHVLPDLALPCSRWGSGMHWEPAPQVNALALALDGKVREAAAAGARG